MDTCRTCAMPLIRTGRRGRPAQYCDADCRIKGLAKAQASLTGRRVRPCSECQKPMQVTRTSAAVMTCRPCRQRLRGQRPLESGARPVEVGPWQKTCAASDCDISFLAAKRTRRFCSQDCLLNNHRAMERIRDAERRRQTPAPALAWHGDPGAGALIAGPPVAITDVLVRTSEDHDLYELRCPSCHCLCRFLTGTGDPGAWGCHACYIKYALLDDVPGHRPFDLGWSSYAA